MKEFPEKRIGSALDGVNADGIAMEGEAFETGDGFGEGGKRSHKAAVGRSFEEVGGAFCGDRKSEGMELLAMLDVLIDVFDDVFGKGRSEQAAIA